MESYVIKKSLISATQSPGIVSFAFSYRWNLSFLKKRGKNDAVKDSHYSVNHQFPGLVLPTTSLWHLSLKIHINAELGSLWFVLLTFNILCMVYGVVESSLMCLISCTEPCLILAFPKFSYHWDLYNGQKREWTTSSWFCRSFELPLLSVKSDQEIAKAKRSNSTLKT